MCASWGRPRCARTLAWCGMPDGVPATVGLLGGGVIGGGWAARFALNGADVVLFDPDPEAERKVGEGAEEGAPQDDAAEQPQSGPDAPAQA